MIPFLYLASSSPRRYELLTLLGIDFECLRPEVEEIRAPGELALAYVRRLAENKAQAGAAMALYDRPVLGADTIVLLDDHILEKPRDRTQAIEMLTALSGREHLVVTAIALADDSKRVLSRYVMTRVQFCELSRKEIIGYVISGEPMDKAGAYGIQGYGGSFVRAIYGSYHNVVGLPLVETKELIEQFMAEPIENGRGEWWVRNY